MNKSTEQAVFAMLMLALQKHHRPVRSSTLARVLRVSDSYLKKVLKAMVDAGLLQAVAGRDGGYCLTRPITEFTYGHVFDALEGFEHPVTSTALARAVYEPSDHLEASIALVDEIHAKAAAAFIAELHQLPLARLLVPDALADGLIDWEAGTGG